MPPKGSFFNDGREDALHSAIMSQASQPDSNLQNNPTALLKAINVHIRSQRTQMMIFHTHKLAVSRDVLSRMSPPPKILIELGTYVGNSAVAWGQMLRDLNPSDPDSVRVYSCELEPAFVRIARDFVDLAGLNDNVEIVQGTASESLAKLVQEGKLKKGGVDVVFIDHWEKFYLSDLQKCEELGLFRVGSVVVADNTDIPGAPDYVEYVKAGGSSGGRGVRYESVTLDTTEEKEVPNVLEVSTVVGLD